LIEDDFASRELTELKVSVIICCYTMDRLKDVYEAIKSVQKQSHKPYEIIIVVDHTLELFTKLKAELTHDIKLFLSNGTPGLSEARNVGIHNANGQIIAFLDDDAVAEPDWLKQLVPLFENPGVVAVGGEAIPAWPKGKPPFWFPLDFDFVIGCTNHKRLILKTSGEIRNVTGSNMAFRREVFEKAGIWETALGRCETGNGKFNPSGGEEAELCLRIKNKIPQGLILFEPKSIVHHKVSPKRTTLKYVFNYSFREGITRAMMKKVASRYGKQPLNAENVYLKQILFNSIPHRLSKFYKITPLAQVGVLITSLFLVGVGYLLAQRQYRKELS
jgi:glucosyl-dolichyl phosphate glucuronosyltransferase